jgi:hypothetical protein
MATRDGGAPWFRPDAANRRSSSEIIRRFKTDRSARDALNDTLSFDQIEVLDFAAAFCVGAPNTIWRDTDPSSSASIIARFLRHGKPVAVTPGIRLHRCASLGPVLLHELTVCTLRSS